MRGENIDLLSEFELLILSYLSYWLVRHKPSVDLVISFIHSLRIVYTHTDMEEGEVVPTR